MKNDTLGRKLGETECSFFLSVFLCCQHLLQNAQTSLVLFNKLDNMEQYLTEILSCFLAIVLQPYLRQATVIEELCKLAITALQHYLILQHQQVNQGKVFTSFCEKLLHLLLKVKFVVNDENNLVGKSTLQESRKAEITSQICAVIAAGLFHKDHILNYVTATEGMKDKEPSSKKPRLSSYSNQLFEVLRSSVENTHPERTVLEKDQAIQDLWKKSVCRSLPFILESFLKVSKDEQKLERTAKFRFFIELYNIIPLMGGHSSDPSIPEVDRITILNQMLQIILDHDVYQIAEDNINNQPLFKWLVNLTQCLMQSPDDCDAVLYQSFSTLLKLNHKILEPFLDRIIERCLFKTHQCSEEGEKEKVKVLCDLVETYNKLQQVEHLIKCMLKVAKSSNESLVIPVGVQNKLAESFECCPLTVTLSLLQLFVDDIKAEVECLKHCLSKDEKDFNGTALEVMTVLLVTYLCNSSYNASDQHGIDVKKGNVLHDLMEETKASLLTPLIDAFPLCNKSCQKEVGFCALYLLYGLNEISNYLNHHDIIKSEHRGIQISWNSKLGTFSPHKSWDNMKILTKSRCLMFCTDLLVVQKAWFLLATRSPDQKEINCLVNFLYSFKYSPPNPKSRSQSWNADPFCVTIKNYPAAHWSLAARHAPLLIPHCDDQHVCEFAKFFLETVKSQEAGSQQDNNLLTINQVSLKLLDEGDVLTLPSLQATVVKEFWKLVGESAIKVAGEENPKMANVFSWSVVEGLLSETRQSEKNSIPGNSVLRIRDPGNENEETEFLESSKGEATVESTTTEMHHATCIAQDLADLMNDISSKTTKKRLKRKKDEVLVKDMEDLSDIQYLIDVLLRLPCHCFTPSNQTRCILGLLACDILAQKCSVRVDQRSTIALQLSCRRSLMTILQGCIQHRNFTAWRAVDMTSLFAWICTTSVSQDWTFDGPMSELRFKFESASNDLLGHAVRLCLRSRSQTGLKAIRVFNDQLLASVNNGSTNKISMSNAKTLNVTFTLISACTELLQAKSSHKSSASTASEVILRSAAVLLDLIISVLKDVHQTDSECDTNAEIPVLSLCGILTRAIGLVSGSNISEIASSTEKRLRDWKQVVGLVVTQIMRKLENKAMPLAATALNEQVVICILVLEAIFQFRQEYRDVLTDEF